MNLKRLRVILMTKTDCFAYSPMSCRVLTERICDGKECSFYKTHKQIEEEYDKNPPFNYKHYKETGEKIYYPRRSKN